MDDGWIGEALAMGVPSDQFELHIQPVVELTSEKTAGGEAFVRWRHPEHGVLPAGSWIPQAEATGALPAACRALVHEWIAASAGLDGPIVSFNVSIGQLGDDEFVRSVLAADADKVAGLALEVHHADLARLPSNLVDRLGRLGEHGYALWLDDFGEGPGDLALLDRVPLDVVKFDRSLLDGDDGRLVGLGDAVRERGMTTLIEGIEHGDHHRISAHAGIGFAQGFRYGLPVAAEAFWAEAPPDPELVPVRRQLSGARRNRV